MKKEMIGNVPGNVLGMVADLSHKLQHGKISPEEFGLFLKRKNPFKPEDYPELFLEWRNFYNDFFAREIDFSNLRIPKKQKGFDRLLVMAKGITTQVLYDECTKLFPCWKRADKSLNEAATWNARNAKNSHYAIWVRNRIEADEELKNLSADDIKKKKITTETLAERLLHELKYFKETGKHLDVENITLCSSSRYGDGLVPDAYWDDDKLKVDWKFPAHSYDYLCSRQAVSR